MTIETELETVKRHLRDFKQLEYEERMLRQKYEKTLKEIKNIKSIDVANILAKEALEE